MYDKFIRLLSVILFVLNLWSPCVQTATVNSFCTVTRAYNTSNNPSVETGAKYKPDITFYDVKESPPEEHVTSFQQMELFVEFKCRPTSNPFYEDNKIPFQKTFNTTCASWGQMVLYSTWLQMYVRNFVFSNHFVSHFSERKTLFPRTLIPDMTSHEYHEQRQSKPLPHLLFLKILVHFS